MKDYFGKNCDALKNKKLYLFDMDGTIYLGSRLFDGVTELLKGITDNGGRYVFITNNSSSSVEDYIAKLKKMGITCDKDNFFTSTQAAARLMKEMFPEKLVYAQGTKSFIKELKNNRLDVTEEYDKNAACVLVAFDPEITGEKMRTTCRMLMLGTPYYATNPDWVCPTEFGAVPDCGSMCFGYEKATGRKPVFIGKPEPQMIYACMEKFGVNKSETVVIGDRLYTDIASGLNAGVDTLFVLSGEGTIEDMKNGNEKPAYVLKSVAELNPIK